MVIKTQKQLGLLLRCSDRTIRELQSKGIIPQKSAKGYDVAECVGSYVEHLRDVAAGHLSADGDLDLTEERARLAKEQADAQAMKNEISRGALLDRDDVVSAAQAMISNSRARLLSLPGKLAPRLEGMDPNEIKEELSGAVNEALDELAETRIVADSSSEDQSESG